MIAYAQAQAKVQEQDRVHFYVANILRPLDFPNESFDFINGRFLQSLMKTTSWVSLLEECFRLTKPGGIIRLTETGARAVLAAPNGVRINRLLNRAFWLAGMSFAEDDSSVSPLLKQFVGNAGYRVLKETPYLLNMSYGTACYQPWLEGARPTL